MIKSITEISHLIGEKKFTFHCDFDASLQHIKEAFLQIGLVIMQAANELEQINLQKEKESKEKPPEEKSHGTDEKASS